MCFLGAAVQYIAAMLLLMMDPYVSSFLTTSAIRAADTATLEMLLQARKAATPDTDSNSISIMFMEAVSATADPQRVAQTVQVLLESQTAADSMTSEDMFQALQTAISRQNLPLVHTLLKHPAASAALTMVDHNGRGLLCAAVSAPTPHPCQVASNMQYLRNLKSHLANDKTCARLSATLLHAELATDILTASTAADAPTSRILAAAQLALQTIAATNPATVAKAVHRGGSGDTGRVLGPFVIFARLAAVLIQRGQDAAVADLLLQHPLHVCVRWVLVLQAARDWAAEVYDTHRHIAAVRSDRKAYQYAFISLAAEQSRLSKLLGHEQTIARQPPYGEQLVTAPPPPPADAESVDAASAAPAAFDRKADVKFSRDALYAAVEQGDHETAMHMLIAALKVDWPGLALGSHGSTLLTLAYVSGHILIFKALLKAVACATPTPLNEQEAEAAGSDKLALATFIGASDRLDASHDPRFLFALYESPLAPAEYDWLKAMDPHLLPVYLQPDMDPQLLAGHLQPVVPLVVGLVLMLVGKSAFENDSMLVVDNSEGMAIGHQALIMAVLHACALNLKQQPTLVAAKTAEIMKGGELILQIAMRMCDVTAMRAQSKHAAC